MTEREKFEKWLKEEGKEFATLSEKASAWASWQAALSTRKPCGFMVVNELGKPNKAFRESEAEQAHRYTDFLNNEDIVGNPFRVVPLFYEDQ